MADYLSRSRAICSRHLNTYFANMFAAYDNLPRELKKAAEGKIAVHDASTNSAGHLRKVQAERDEILRFDAAAPRRRE